MLRRLGALAGWLLVATPALGGSNEDARRAAESYLAAVAGSGDEAGRELLLGGATMNAQLFTLENFRLVSKEPVRQEQGDLSNAVAMIAALDEAGQEALSGLGSTASAAGEGLAFTEISASDAAKLMGPTRQRAAQLLEAHPVLAYVARVDKQVYWHPRNPIRRLLQQAGSQGRYSLELHLWKVETREGPRHVARVWPLRVVRFRAGAVDTGFKVIPASDWNAE